MTYLTSRINYYCLSVYKTRTYTIATVVLDSTIKLTHLIIIAVSIYYYYIPI